MGDAYLCRRGGNTLRGLIVIVPPAKTSYYAGEYVDLTGMIIGADFGTFTVPISQTAYSYTPAGALTAADTAITVTAEIGGRTKSVAIPITVDSVNPDFGQNTWETIARVAALGQAGNYWSVGDSKVVDGVTYTIIGMNHDSLSSTDAKYADASYNGNSQKAALTIQIMTASGAGIMNQNNTNVGGWDNCYMRKTALPAYLSGMPSDIRSIMRTVDKITSIGGTGTTGMTTSRDKLFLLAVSEMYSSTGGWVLPNEATANPQYAYYADMPPYKNVHEWTRSPHNPDNCVDHDHFIVINSSGNLGVYVTETSAYYFPAFCI